VPSNSLYTARNCSCRLTAAAATPLPGGLGTIGVPIRRTQTLTRLCEPHSPAIFLFDHLQQAAEASSLSVAAKASTLSITMTPKGQKILHRGSAGNYGISSLGAGATQFLLQPPLCLPQMQLQPLALPVPVLPTPLAPVSVGLLHLKPACNFVTRIENVFNKHTMSRNVWGCTSCLQTASILIAIKPITSACASKQDFHANLNHIMPCMWRVTWRRAQEADSMLVALINCNTCSSTATRQAPPCWYADDTYLQISCHTCSGFFIGLGFHCHLVHAAPSKGYTAMACRELDCQWNMTPISHVCSYGCGLTAIKKARTATNVYAEGKTRVIKLIAITIVNKCGKQQVLTLL